MIFRIGFHEQPSYVSPHIRRTFLCNSFQRFFPTPALVCIASSCSILSKFFFKISGVAACACIVSSCSIPSEFFGELAIHNYHPQGIVFLRIVYLYTLSDYLMIAITLILFRSSLMTNVLLLLSNSMFFTASSPTSHLHGY